MSSSYFGSHSSGGKIRVTNSSDLLAALKIQTIYNANQSNPKSKIRTAGHTNPAEMQAQFNAVAQQINYGVKHTQNFTPSIPSGPSILTTTPLNQSVRVTWNPPSNSGGGEITSYLLKATRQSSPYTVLTQESTGAGRVYTFTGLTNGVSYKMSVAAVNAAGVSEYSALSNTVTPVAGQPGAPTNVTVSIHSITSIDVSWTAPADNGGASITKYTVYAYDPTSPLGTTSQNTSGPSPTSLTFTGLTTGTTYYFRVAAWNSGSVSPNKSDASATIAPCGATNEPGAPSGDGGNTNASLLWTAPSDLQGSVIDHYQVEMLNSSGGSLVPAVILSTPNADRTYIVTGIQNGVGKKFRVRSVTTNDAVSSWSGNSAVITPSATPSKSTPTAPTSLGSGYDGIDGTVGGGVHLAWAAPSIPVSPDKPSRYVISRRLTGSSYEYSPIKYVPGNVLECLIKTGDIGLDGETPISIPNGTAYDYVVHAEDVLAAVPVGPYSDPTTFTASRVPSWDPPSGGVKVSKAGVGELAVSWDAAMVDGAPISGYNLYVSATQDPGDSIALPSSPLSYTVQNLPIEPLYVWLTAANAAGTSVYTDPGIVQTPLAQVGDHKPSAPYITSVTNYKNSETGALGAILTYTRTDFSTGSHYWTVTATKVSDGSTVVVSPFSDIIPGLDVGETYTFTIRQTFDGVDSDESDPWADPLLISDVPAKIDLAPTIDSSHDDGSFTISWNTPSSDTPITGYVIQVIANGLIYDTIETQDLSTTRRVGDLAAGAGYQFKVYATNGLETIKGYTHQDYSPLSDPPVVPVFGAGTELAPDAPSDSPVATPLDGRVVIGWEYKGSPGSQNDNPSAIVQYNVYYRVHGSGSYTQDGTVSLNTTGYTFTGLTNGTQYDFVYTAINGNSVENESGYSPAASATPTSSYGGLTPGPPTQPLTVTYDLTSYDGSPGYTLAWGAPSTGEPAVCYIVQYTLKEEDNSAGGIITNNGVTGQSLTLPAYNVPYGIYQFSVQSAGAGNTTSEPVQSEIF